MKNSILFIIAISLFLCNETILSQSKYGNASKEELSMTAYPQDTTASAVILLKKGKTVFTYDDRMYGFQYRYEVEMKIKILKAEGLNWASSEIKYIDLGNNRRERIDGLSGTTYNIENGKIEKTKLTKDLIAEESVNDKYKLCKFTLPAAKIGSVIEYKYAIQSDFIYDLPEFRFQEGIPIAETSYEIVIPEYFKFNMNSTGYEKIDVKQEPTNEKFAVRYVDEYGSIGAQNVVCLADKYTFKGKDIPALKREDYLWSAEDYRTKIGFDIHSIHIPYSKVINLNTTWENIDKEIFNSGSFKDNLKKAGMFKGEIQPMNTTLENASKVLGLVKNKVKWNNEERILPTSLDEAVKKGIGSSADMNFLLINALRAGGFESYPVMIRTRNLGRVPLSHPTAYAFDYLITAVLVDSTLYYTDAAYKYGDWNILPRKCMIPQARLLTDVKSAWIDLSTISAGTTYINTKYKFVDNKLQGNVSIARKGGSASNFREAYYEGHKDKNEYIEKLANSLAGQVENFNIENEGNGTDDVNLSFDLKTNTESGDEFLYINPLYIKHFSDNPFKSEKRILPVNFDFPLNYIQVVEIEIPEGYAVEELPKAERFILNETSPIRLIYNVTQENGKVKIHYQYSLKTLMFLPEEYESLREFFGKIVTKNQEQIVLKKI